MAKERAIYKRSVRLGPLRQGEIVSNLIQAHLDPASIRSRSGLSVLAKVHNVAIVISQDCDLDWDFKARSGQANPDKLLPNVLFCEAITAEELRGKPDINSQKWNNIKINKDERYQFLQAVLPVQDRLKQGLPELGIDFKRYFTIPAEEVYLRLMFETQRRCHLISPYVEHLSARFYYFQSHIGLPADHFSEPANR